MNVEQMLQQTNAIDAISRELGVDPATARAGATALMPSILSGFHNPANTQSAIGGNSGGSALLGGNGLDGLLKTIGGLGGSTLLDSVTSSQPTEVDKGNQILGKIFGSKDGSRAVAADAASQSSLEPSLLKKMLPILAMVVAGYVMKQASQGTGGLGGALGDALGGQSSSAPSIGSPQAVPTGPGNILGQLIGAAGKYLGR